MKTKEELEKINKKIEALEAKIQPEEKGSDSSEVLKDNQSQDASPNKGINILLMIGGSLTALILLFLMMTSFPKNKEILTLDQPKNDIVQLKLDHLFGSMDFVTQDGGSFQVRYTTSLDLIFADPISRQASHLYSHAISRNINGLFSNGKYVDFNIQDIGIMKIKNSMITEMRKNPDNKIRQMIISTLMEDQRTAGLLSGEYSVKTQQVQVNGFKILEIVLDENLSKIIKQKNIDIVKSIKTVREDLNKEIKNILKIKDTSRKHKNFNTFLGEGLKKYIAEKKVNSYLVFETKQDDVAYLNAEIMNIEYLTPSSFSVKISNKSLLKTDLSCNGSLDQPQIKDNGTVISSLNEDGQYSRIVCRNLKGDRIFFHPLNLSVENKVKVTYN